MCFGLILIHPSPTALNFWSFVPPFLDCDKKNKHTPVCRLSLNSSLRILYTDIFGCCASYWLLNVEMFRSSFRSISQSIKFVHMGGLIFKEKEEKNKYFFPCIHWQISIMACFSSCFCFLLPLWSVMQPTSSSPPSFMSDCVQWCVLLTPNIVVADAYFAL